MKRCEQCGEEMQEGARFCPSCGRPASSFTDLPTEDAAPRRPSSQSPARPPSSSGSVTDMGRFAPGEVLIERYRIIGLLGRGGMGEVYRADDLKLQQAVALKFLPDVGADPRVRPAEGAHAGAPLQDLAALDRFRAEVRNARQVAHPNVCRVYDIGEIGGRAFLSMEYVDGEDLASLLRRIGRLPQAKALEIARQLCAGLAAAHDKGVLHRDLKPSNIMIDGQGRARITDFGLAVRAEENLAEGNIVGTPAYMSPEQLAGRAATVKSDLYALGLVLYEIFTGKKPFEAKTVGEWKRKHEEEQPSVPSSVVTDIDPAVERIILRCLEKDPKLRPASALQVAAALPGGDPLAAALAAGETPSPDLVAAAGETEGFKPRTAIACLVFIIAGIVATCALNPRVSMPGFVPLGDSPEVMAAKAQSLIRQFGYTAPPVDSAYRYKYDNDYLRYIKDHEKSRNRWEQLKTGFPSAIEFWYRASPRYLEPGLFFGAGAPNGAVDDDDPPRNVSGMTFTILDPSGRLEYFDAVPPQKDEAKGTAPVPDWAGLFTAAGLDMTKFKAVEPEWTPPEWSDTRAAWTGTAPGRPNVPLRVEAAAYHGKPVYFQLIWPWTRAGRMQPYQPTSATRIFNAVSLVLLLAVLIGAVLLARRNLRLGRGDRRGAFRLAIFVLLVLMSAWALAAHHVSTSYEFGLFVMGVSFALFYAALVWLLYIGLEPYVRRRWPSSIISWSRVLAGQFRDPLVGRDILTGVTLGIGITLWFTLKSFPEGWFGKLPPQPQTPPLLSLLGARDEFGMLMGSVGQYLAFALAVFFLFFLLRLLFRKDWLAGAGFVLIFVAAVALPGNYPLVDAVFVAVTFGSLILILKRFGLFPLVAFFIASEALYISLPTTHLSVWYAGSTIIGIVFVLALAIYGFRTSLAGQTIFSGSALDD
jgi:Protein kinase domain/zinc-ribbon domain